MLTVEAQEIHPQRTYPKFRVGVTGIEATIEPGRVVTVRGVLDSSPAEGKLEQGDQILKANGLTLMVDDPRVPLGNAIGKSEAEAGRFVLEVKRGTKTLNVKLVIPVLGKYSSTWPEDCKKSTAIVEATAKYLAGKQQDDGSYLFDRRKERDGLAGCLAGLFLLSTNDPQYLPLVQKQARALSVSAEQRPTGSSWHLGYQGILLGEYYLKTGDKSVLAGLKSLCDQALRTQAAGGWGHGGIPNPGYVQSGLMNSAGVPVLTTLILARECGVEVEEAGFLRSLKFFYRMAGHGNVCYGDHRSELWWPNTNGRNAMLACGLILLEEPRCQQAAEHMAMLVADSYYKPEFGHTGGGFNVIWRGMGSVHVPKHRRSHYQRQMNELSWYYDLARQPDGGFSMLPSPPDTTRYTGAAWGTGAIGLTYTAPRRTLRITGAPRTQYSVASKSPNLKWGTPADLQFLSSDDAAGFGEEEASPKEVYDRLLGKRKSTATVAFCSKHLRHYSPMVRSWAARRLNELNSTEANAALAKAAKHEDPRVRRAAFDGVSGYDNWGRPMRTRASRESVSASFTKTIESVLSDSNSAWWEIDGALFALGRAQPSEIRANLPIIKKFSTHEEWYLREAAFWAIDGLRESMNAEEFKQLAEQYAASEAVFARSSYDAGFREVLQGAKLKFDDDTLKTVARSLGSTLHKPIVKQGYGTGGIHEAAHRTMMITKHFDEKIYTYMVDDIDQYLKIWEPYYQHSVWIISGSNWQPGILKVLDSVGAEGRPIVNRLKLIVADYEKFDKAKFSGGGKELKTKIVEAVQKWEAKWNK